jgi:radical SAM protein with 4Fe4S-binding SPASM domain
VGEDEDPTFSVGHLDTGVDEEKLSRMRAEKERIEVDCADCELRARCSSSCGCKHVALTGEYGRVTSTLCDTEAAFIEAADALAETLYAEGCEAFLDFFYRKRWAPTQSTGLVPLRRKAVASQSPTFPSALPSRLAKSVP